MYNEFMRVEKGPRGYKHEASMASQKEERAKETIEELRPLTDLADRVDLSVVRMQALLKEGKLEGELRLNEGRGKGKWYTSVEAVRDYKAGLPSSQEWGRKGGLIAGRGRPKTQE